MHAAVGPLSFVPPIATWGEGAFGPADALVLRFKPSEVSDPAACFDMLVDLLGPHVHDHGQSAAFQIADDTDGWPKSVVTERGALLDTGSLMSWWAREKVSSAVLEYGRVRCSIVSVATGVVHLKVALTQPSDTEIEVFGSQLAEAARGLPGWFGHLGLGAGWATNSAPGAMRTTVLGYGPLVVAAITDLDVTSVDLSLVDVNDLGDGRLVLGTTPGTDIETAVKEIRRICWPAWGYRCANEAMSTSLFFEGGWSKRSMMGLLAVERFVHKKFRRVVRSVSNGGPVASVVGPGTAQLQNPVEDMAQHLADINRVVAAWQRGATAVTSASYLHESGLVDCAIELGDTHVTIHHGACAKEALRVLEECFATWPLIFGTESPGPLQWSTT